MANYLDENGLKTLADNINGKFVPYTGAKKDINIGSHVFTVGSESSVYTQTTPGSIALKNPLGTLSIGISSLTVNGTTIYWPTVSADPNGKYFALKSDIPANIKDGTGNGSLNQIKDGTGTTFSIDDSSGNSKNPNAYALDNTIKGDIVFGGVGDYSTSLGGKSSAQGKRSVAQGTTTIAKGNYSHAEGDNSVALGPDSHAEGYATVTYGKASHSEGTSTQAIGEGSHAEGSNTKATKTGAHSEGEETDASGYASHTEGLFNKVLSEIPADTGGSGSGITPPPSTGWNIEEHRGDAGHAEGYGNVVYGFASHAEGHQNKSSGHYSHSEGLLNTASGNYSHAEGTGCLASGTGAHAGGSYCYAITSNAFAHGQSLTTNIPNQAVLGEYNLDLPFSSRETQYLFAIGNGTDVNHRSNAFVSYKDGRAAIGKDPVNDLDVATKGYVDRGIDAASQKMVSIIYDDLVTARNSKDLVPGMNYRITDYTAVISPGSVTEKSAGHQFDLIVTADGPDTLNENARAILHEGDTYFKDCDLNSWRLKYCLDNDRSRFYWAYEKGKGVIYWMEDEFHNQVPYDFKNIMFKRYKVNTVGKNTPVSFDSFFNGTGNLSLTDCISPVKTSAIGDVASDTSIWCYTFCTFENNDPTIPLDASLNLFPDGIVVETPRLLSFLHAFDNVIEPLIVCSPSIETTKKNYQRLNNIVFMKYDKDTSVDTKDNFRVYGNRFSSGSQNITLGRKCYYNTFNGNNLGLMVGYGCAENTFTTCGNTAIAYNCSGNIFNSRFGYNLVFNNCKNNSFGMKCQYLELGENSSFNTFEDDISYVRLVADSTGTEPLQYVTVSTGVKGTGVGNGMLHLSQPRGLTHTVTYRRVQSETIDV